MNNKENKKYMGEIIPKDIPVTEYAGYILKNFKPEILTSPKPESEWTEQERKEYAKWQLKLSMAHRLKRIVEKGTVTNRDKRIIERFRSGADFYGEKGYGREQSRLFEYSYTIDLYDEWEEKHFKEHTEDKDKSPEKLFDIQLFEKKLYHYEV